MTKQKRKTCRSCGRKLVLSKLVEVWHREARWQYSDRDMSEFVCKKCLLPWRKQHKGESWWHWIEIDKVSAEISGDTKKKPKTILKTT